MNKLLVRLLMRAPTAVLLALVLLPLAAHAQAVAGGTDVAGMLNNVVTYLEGTLATAIGTLAIIIVGGLFMFGRLSGLFALSAVLGIAIWMSAPTIIQTIRGG